MMRITVSTVITRTSTEVRLRRIDPMARVRAAWRASVSPAAWARMRSALFPWPA